MNKTRIIAFGDAVTLGTSAKLDVFHDCFQYGTTTVNLVRETQTWRSISERILTDWIEGDVEMIDAGMAGDTSSKGLARMDREVLSHAPDTVLVTFGAEDALQGIETEAFRKNLEKIVDGIAARNAKPVLMTPTPISERMTASGCTLSEVRQRQERLSALAQAVRSLAEEKSLLLIDLHRYFLDNRLAYDHLFEGWLPDGVAQSGMASFVAGELLSILGVNDFPKPVLCDYRKVYSDAEHPEAMHHAFTDLAYFQGEFFITFRKGYSHSTPTTTNPESDVIVVLRSRDGIAWSEDAVLKVLGMDNRDPKFLCHSDDRLTLFDVCASVPRRPGQPDVITYGFERLGPGRWSDPFECGPCVFWRPKKWRDQYVVAVYRLADEEGSVTLLSSRDARNWKAVSTILPHEAEGDETDLFVQDDQLMAFARAERGSHFKMLLSTYAPSENRWETVSSGRIIHAPNVFEVGERVMLSGRYCAQSDEGFRELEKDWKKFTRGTTEESFEVDPARVEAYHHGLRTGIFVMDGTKPRLVMELLSAGDSSYTGVVPYGDEFVISDYSMHEYYPEIKRPDDWETPSDIYVSRIRFGA
jgi:lysophospholipase L1-like esterase